MALQWGTRLTFHMLTWPHQWLLLLFMHQDGIIKRVPRPFIHPISTPVAPLAKPTTTKVAIQSPVRVVHVQSQAKCNNNRVTMSKIGHIRAKSSFHFHISFLSQCSAFLYPQHWSYFLSTVFKHLQVLSCPSYVSCSQATSRFMQFFVSRFSRTFAIPVLCVVNVFSMHNSLYIYIS